MKKDNTRISSENFPDTACPRVRAGAHVQKCPRMCARRRSAPLLSRCGGRGSDDVRVLAGSQEGAGA